MMRWIAVAAAAVVACGSGCAARKTTQPPRDATPADAGAVWPRLTTDHLALAPADTPFVLVQSDPLPADVIDRLAPMLEPMEGAIDLGLREAFQKMTPEDQAMVEAAFEGTPSLATFRRAGLAVNAPFILYGLGPAPVLRWRLSDPDRFRAVIEDGFPARASEGVQHFHGQSYFRKQADDGSTAILALVGPDLVTAYLPRGEIQPELLALVFGQAVPEVSLAASGKLDAIRKTHGLTRSAAGYVDFAALTDMFLVPGDGLNRRVIEAFSGAVGEVEPECTVDAQRVTQAFPRLVTGFESLSSKSVRWSLTLETSPTIASWLARLPGSIPQPYETDAPLLLNLAAGIDLGVLIDGLRAFGDAIRREPFRCTAFAELNGLVALTAANLDGIPESVASIQGASMSIIDVVPGTDDPTEVLFVVDVPAPKRAVQTLFADVPGFRPRRLRAGRAVPLSRVFTADKSNDKGARSWINLGERSVGVSLGPDADPPPATTIDRRRPRDGALLVSSMDFVRWENRRPDRIERLLREQGRLVAELAAGMLALLSHVEVSLHATERGLSLRQDLRADPQP